MSSMKSDPEKPKKYKTPKGGTTTEPKPTAKRPAYKAGYVIKKVVRNGKVVGYKQVIAGKGEGGRRNIQHVGTKPGPGYTWNPTTGQWVKKK